MSQATELPRRLSLEEFHKLTDRIDMEMVDDVEGDFLLADVIWQIRQSLFWESCAAGQANLAEQART